MNKVIKSTKQDIRLDVKTKQALDTVAFIADVSISEVIRIAIREYLERLEAENTNK